jgi:hypothetical protein
LPHRPLPRPPLVTVNLTPEAEQRLRLVTAPVARRAVPAVRLFGGEVVNALSAPGARLAPVLGGGLEDALRAADQQAVADGRVEQAKVQVEAAKLALRRAEEVLRQEAGSQRAVDEARAALASAEPALRTAVAQRGLLGTSPERGRLLVRVPVFSGELELLDLGAAARVRPLAATGPGVDASPVDGPATASAVTSTVDRYFGLPEGFAARAGERLAVEIPLKGSGRERLVVPFASVLHDIHGGQWVYVATAPHAYSRRRVQVERVAGGDAVLASGPVEGTKVVTDGAAELFGTEFVTGR